MRYLRTVIVVVFLVAFVGVSGICYAEMGQGKTKVEVAKDELDYTLKVAGFYYESGTQQYKMAFQQHIAMSYARACCFIHGAKHLNDLTEEQVSLKVRMFIAEILGVMLQYRIDFGSCNIRVED